VSETYIPAELRRLVVDSLFPKFYLGKHLGAKFYFAGGGVCGKVAGRQRALTLRYYTSTTRGSIAPANVEIRDRNNSRNSAASTPCASE
jgi:hypothetical protein